MPPSNYARRWLARLLLAAGVAATIAPFAVAQATAEGLTYRIQVANAVLADEMGGVTKTEIAQRASLGIASPSMIPGSAADVAAKWKQLPGPLKKDRVASNDHDVKRGDIEAAVAGPAHRPVIDRGLPEATDAAIV